MGSGETRTNDDLSGWMAVLLSFVGGMLFEIDSDGQYLSVWTGTPELLAAPENELRGRNVVDVLGPAIGARFVMLARDVLRSGVAQTVDYVLDVPAGRRTFRCETRPSVSTNMPANGAVTLLVRDVTEETQLKAKLVEAERLAAMGLIAASVGHEIRQPLAFATTSVEVLARELTMTSDPSPRALEALGHVRDAVRRIAGIAANVGVLAPDRQRDTTTDVRRPIEAAVDLCASELQGRARVSVAVPELPRVRANEGELCQVVANLLLNAAHAVDPAHAATNRIHVTATLRERGASVRIAVSDDGCGIDPAHVGRVFDPFFTTKGPGRGTGLGLFVSKRIVEEAGGTLEIESRLNGGTSVFLTLPVVTGDTSAVSPPPAASPTRRLAVLVVDDEPAFLRSLKLVLEDTHDVVVCGRSRDALALLGAEPTRFDAVLCDLSMPEIDGVEFHGAMEMLGIAQRFVLMTAGAFTPRGEHFLRESGCRRIGKPFTIEALLDALGSVTSRA
jgi:two-component system NtrC family sensor kinase